RPSSGARTPTRWPRPTRPSAISSGSPGQVERMTRQVPLAKTRNIGIIAHIDAGKTTVTERILFYTKKIYKLGEVHEGAATMDWSQRERPSVPLSRFTTTRKWPGADLWSCVDMIVDLLGARAVPIHIPIGNEALFEGVVDLVEMKAILYRDDLGSKIDVVEVPEALRAEAEQHREKMVEIVAEVDDTLTHKYLEGEALTPEELRHGLRLGTLQSRFVPVLAGSALKNKGVQPMLDAVTLYLPSPLDAPPIIGVRPRTDQEAVRTADDKEPFTPLDCKLAADPPAGTLAA